MPCLEYVSEVDSQVTVERRVLRCEMSWKLPRAQGLWTCKYDRESSNEIERSAKSNKTLSTIA